ncbi:MAG: FAD-dependent oxidoreductase [Phycisphaeraceae bacterium]
MMQFEQAQQRAWDVVVVGGTPGGIMTAVAAARSDASVLLLERTNHIGGLPANGLGVTDITTRGATGGLFSEFVHRIHSHYVATYGPDAPQVHACDGGHYFEPSVAERVFETMLAEQAEAVTVLTERQFDALPDRVQREAGRVASIDVRNCQTGQFESYRGRVFVDATYEGDLAAAAGAAFRTRREAAHEYHEPLAGKVYKQWKGEVEPGSTGEGDETIQAYNYRVCLTDQPQRQLPISRPAGYQREEYVSLIDDLTLERMAGECDGELHLDGIGRIVNIFPLPNGKTDSNNQHLALISTDLPEENYLWPTADWAWRDRFAQRLRDYTLGLLWFAQYDPALPADFRAACQRWGLAKDEYQDNGCFPRQVYVREGRRIEGEHLFVASDALPVVPGGRPPIYASSVTASHYALDSHAVRKREPGRLSLDGFLSHPTQPYTVPLGVMTPRGLDNVLTPVPVSGTHIGFSTLRMEPCWMALGQAAGVAAAMAALSGWPIRELDTAWLQRRLLDQGAALMYYRDIRPDHPAFKAVQFFGVRGAIPAWEARPDDPATADDLAQWTAIAGRSLADVRLGTVTRGEVLRHLYDQAQASLPRNEGRSAGTASSTLRTA